MLMHIAVNLVCCGNLVKLMLRKLTWCWLALEALSEGLAQELDPNWNIKVNLYHS